jgi:hypothetical protein
MLEMKDVRRVRAVVGVYSIMYVRRVGEAGCGRRQLSGVAKEALDEEWIVAPSRG